MIIDAQIHCWRDTPEYPTPAASKKRHGREEHTVEQALARMDQAGIHRSILVPIAAWPSGPRNLYELDAARRYPDRFAVMGLVDIDAEASAAVLKDWRQPGMLGVRRYFHSNPGRLADGSLEWLWEGLVENDLPFMSAAPNQMELFHPILQKYPDLRLIIDHAGREPYEKKDEACWSDLDDTLYLARYANVSIKVSLLPSFSTQPYPFPVLHEPIRKIYDSFGPERMLWGSDVTLLKWGFENNVRLFTEALPFLGREDKEWIMGKAAAKACGWPIS